MQILRFYFQIIFYIMGFIFIGNSRIFLNIKLILLLFQLIFSYNILLWLNILLLIMHALLFTNISSISDFLRMNEIPLLTLKFFILYTKFKFLIIQPTPTIFPILILSFCLLILKVTSVRYMIQSLSNICLEESNLAFDNIITTMYLYFFLS